MEKVTIGNAELYCADCADVVPVLDGFDLIATDPPYGVAMNKNKGRRAKNADQIAGDDVPPVVGWMTQHQAIIWGGNNFDLPRSTGWLVWFKHHPDGSQHSQAELAWTNTVSTIRHYSEAYHGFMRQRDGWFHPTQKPPGLMRWCIAFAPKAKVILDPYMGSGTTGIASAELGKRFIGIERERKYFDIACERISQAQAQGRLAI